MKPNLLFINLDQQRYDCLGFNGSTLVKTPNLDRLAAAGMRFSGAYTPIPLCCPARQTLLCGLMPDLHGGLWNYDICSPVAGLSPQAVTWPRLLSEAGYDCVYLGKWHVHPDHDATRYGYRVYENGLPLFNPDKLVQRHRVKSPVGSFGVGEFEDVPVAEAHTHRLAAQASEWLNKLTAGGEPWHLRVDFHEPHLPCYCAREFADLYDPAGIPPWPNFEEKFSGKPFIQRQQIENWGLKDWTWHEWSIYLAAYFGVVSQVDDAIGLILRALRDSGQEQNTLVVFTADHGDAAGSHRMMDKHYVMYEEEVRVPMVMCWPGVIPAGQCSDDWIVHYLDLPPTLLEAAGLPVDQSFQGRSFFPVMRGEQHPMPRNEVFSSYNGQQFGLYTQRMIRDHSAKYVWNATDVDEFYDMRTDPHEMNNLAEDPARAEQVRRYRHRLHDCFAALGDPMIKNNRWVGSVLKA